jgi:nickel/cobalt transporter (NiCoT) family protein
MAMSASIATLHLVGWFTLIAIVALEQLSVGSKAFGIGLGVTAYTLGMRHAFDADHIAAIDNTTRKLMGEGKRPLSVGFWFSLGHASIVFGLTLLLAVGIRAIVGPVSDSGSELHNVTGLIGALVSSGFLYLIAAFNIVALVNIWKTFRRRHTRRGYDELALERRLEERGLISRLLGQTMMFREQAMADVMYRQQLVRCAKPGPKRSEGVPSKTARCALWT